MFTNVHKFHALGQVHPLLVWHVLTLGAAYSQANFPFSFRKGERKHGGHETTSEKQQGKPARPLNTAFCALRAALSRRAPRNHPTCHESGRSHAAKERHGCQGRPLLQDADRILELFVRP